MRRRATHPGGLGHAINVTPLIDVVMCLIVFYLIVGKLAMEKQERVDLPESRTGASASVPPVMVIAVRPPAGSPIVTVDGREVDAASLSLRFGPALAADPATQVHIRADRGLPYAAIAPVLRACREAGLSSVRLVTERAP